MSHIFFEDTIETLKRFTGELSTDSWAPWLAKTEEDLQAYAKKLFNEGGLSHWDEQAKIAMFIIGLIVPSFLSLLFLCLWVLFIFVNKCHRSRFERDIAELEETKQELEKTIQQIISKAKRE